VRAVRSVGKSRSAWTSGVTIAGARVDLSVMLGCLREWQDAEVVRDSNWISSRQPSDIPMFNRAMIELFTEKKAAREEKIQRVA